MSGLCLSISIGGLISDGTLTGYGIRKGMSILTCSLRIRKLLFLRLFDLPPDLFVSRQGCQSSSYHPHPIHRISLNVFVISYLQGHCHPRIVATLVEQAQKLTLSSRAFYNSVFGQYAKKVTSLLGYDMVLPMNTGAEAVETAIKLSRKWAYEKKGVPEGKAIVLSVEGNFHGRTIGIIRCVLSLRSPTSFLN